MRLIRQTTDYNCGQTCIAMVAGVSISTACKAVGGRGYTNDDDLRRGLAVFGYTLGRVHPVGAGSPVPPLAIVFIRYLDKYGSEKKHGHVAVWERGVIYDPSYGVQPDYPKGTLIKRYAEIKKKRA